MACGDTRRLPVDETDLGRALIYHPAEKASRLTDHPIACGCARCLEAEAYVGAVNRTIDVLRAEVKRLHDGNEDHLADFESERNLHAYTRYELERADAEVKRLTEELERRQPACPCDDCLAHACEPRYPSAAAQ